MSRAWLLVLLAISLGAKAQEPSAEPAPQAEPAPAEAAPVESAPAETAPVETVETIPVEDTSAEDAAVKKGATRLDDVIVTATKREASARDLAATVSAISGDKLAEMGAQDIEDIVTMVPGVNLVDERSGGQPNSVKRITIRGIAAGMNQVDTVGVFIDETPFTDPFQPLSSGDINPFDISQVEILKGPVGTLFGGSALNGAIRYLPEKPRFAEWQGKGFAEWRTFDYGRAAPVFGAMANIPLGRDDLALRVVGMDRKTAGWIDSVNPSYQAKDVNGTDQQSVRGILRWMPLDRLDTSLTFIHQDTLSTDFGNSTADRNGEYENSSSVQPSPSRVTYDLWQLKGSYSFDWAELVAIASQSQKTLEAIFDQSGSVDRNPTVSELYTDYVSHGKPGTQEVRLVSTAGGDWDWLIGGYHSLYKLDFIGGVFAGEGTLPPVIGGLPSPLPVTSANGAVVGYTANQGTVGETSAFGETSWRFAEDWQLTGGLRAYQFNYDILVTFDGPICAATDQTCVANSLHTDIPVENKEQGFSPKLSLKWDFSKDVMVYATGARGFRFGGVNSVSHPEIPRTYNSDSLWSYELGTRTQWLENTLIADLTAFHIDWTNAQYQTVTSDGLGFGYTDNVGAVKGDGLEGQLVWLTPIPGVKLTAVGSYADIVTAKDYTRGSASAPAGTRWPRAPKVQTTTSLDYTYLLDRVELSTGVTHTYLGEALQNFGSNSNVTIFGYSTYGLQFNAKPVAAKWWPEISFTANNLTRTRGVNYFYDGAAGAGAQIRTYTTPRNYSARLTFSF